MKSSFGRRRQTPQEHRGGGVQHIVLSLIFLKYISDAVEELHEKLKAGKGENVRDGAKPGGINPNTPYVGLEHVERKCIALYDAALFGSVESNKSKPQENDILLGKLRPYAHKVCFTPFAGVCSTDIFVNRPKNGQK